MCCVNCHLFFFYSSTLQLPIMHHNVTNPAASLWSCVTVLTLIYGNSQFLIFKVQFSSVLMMRMSHLVCVMWQQWCHFLCGVRWGKNNDAACTAACPWTPPKTSEDTNNHTSLWNRIERCKVSFLHRETRNLSLCLFLIFIRSCVLFLKLRPSRVPDSWSQDRKIKSLLLTLDSEDIFWEEKEWFHVSILFPAFHGDAFFMWLRVSKLESGR